MCLWAANALLWERESLVLIVAVRTCRYPAPHSFSKKTKIMFMQHRCDRCDLSGASTLTSIIALILDFISKSKSPSTLSDWLTNIVGVWNNGCRGRQLRRHSGSWGQHRLLLLSSAEQEVKGRCLLCVDGRGYIGWAILRQPYSI